MLGAWVPGCLGLCMHVHMVCACGIYGVCTGACGVLIVLEHVSVCVVPVQLSAVTMSLPWADVLFGATSANLSLTLGLMTQGKTVLAHVWGRPQACGEWRMASLTRGNTVEKCPALCWSWEWPGSEVGFTCGFLAHVLVGHSNYSVRIGQV